MERNYDLDKPRRGRPAGKYKPADTELHLIVVQTKVPRKHLRRIDDYCDDTRTPRTEFIKTAIFKYMTELGIYEHRPVPYNPPVVKPPGKDNKSGPESGRTWVTDPGDFGQPDENPNVPTSSVVREP